MTATTETTTGVGRVARVTGPVVDVEFPVEAMPELYNALTVDVSFDSGDEGGGAQTLTLEVAQHIGDNMVRAISMQPTDGLVRGAPVQDTGDAITVPVGDVTKGHVWNTLGVPLDVDAAVSTSASAGAFTARHPPSISWSRRPRSSPPASM